MRKCLICRERNIESYGICAACKQMNEKMQTIHTDLTGYTAVVTGGRIRIGFATALRLLRDGAKVIVITRYPYDALDRYKKEPDYEEFKERLIIYGFNLMWVNRIGELISFIKEQSPQGLDILVNNAAQTIKKTRKYYQELEYNEQQMKSLHTSADCALITYTAVENSFENMLMPVNGAPGIREEGPLFNSWVAMAEDISVQEMLEVQLINVTTPFMLVGQLKQWMKKSPHKNKFIINVSSVEGRFNKRKKMSRHVHTNMAKASLNMMTHSLSAEYEKDRIYIYSVDPGWVSNQFPAEYNASKEFEQYLTFEDAASRICYPVYTKLDEDVIKDAGSLWKDYKIEEY